ncbi:hypothetical protein [Streptomyces sp. 11x1]|uniref:hypothetical protein n=1 Tax=Streptomyces sp. 11x1 TaxID=3038642 RepID=UPI00292F3B4D|nr:hypothetical protein [Streptomyces sp. 11x1]WNZ09096.1 hypothetical protein P8T65_16885 [Streptomyces sp. 11x1]
MILMDNIFTSQYYRPAAESVGWDPLKEPDALEDAQLLDCRVCPTVNRAALLFEMRTASYYPTGNSALLVVRGLRSFQWSGSPQRQKLMAFSVISSRPSHVVDGGLRLDFQFFPDGDLSFGGECMEFYLLEVHGISEAPPSYPGNDLDQVCRDLPSWNSECTVLQSSSMSGK